MSGTLFDWLTCRKVTEQTWDFSMQCMSTSWRSMATANREMKASYRSPESGSYLHPNNANFSMDFLKRIKVRNMKVKRGAHLPTRVYKIKVDVTKRGFLRLQQSHVPGGYHIS
jgi:hypothetical protein